MKISSSLLAIAALGLLGSNLSAALVISQYYEGSVGANRLLEVWNPEASPIDFSVSSLVVENYTNGSSTASSNFTLNTGSLAAGAVLVIANTDTTGDGAILGAGLSVIDTTSSALNFNGDDALAIRLGGVLQDVFGQIGLDPGSSWVVGGVNTTNMNLELIDNTFSVGDTNGSDPFDPSVRFKIAFDPANVTAASLVGFGVAPVPEPSAVAWGAALAVLVMAWRRRRA